MSTPSTKENRVRRHSRIRSRVHGTEERPRLAVFKSNKYLYAQIINDDAGKTLAAASSLHMKKTKSKDKESAATFVGKQIAEKALGKKVKKVVFDRGGFLYRGKIKEIAESARAGGLQF